jgi:peptide/bleomycin uptake transporter
MSRLFKLFFASKKWRRIVFGAGVALVVLGFGVWLSIDTAWAAAAGGKIMEFAREQNLADAAIQTGWFLLLAVIAILTLSKIAGSSFGSFFLSKEYFWKAYGRAVFLVAMTFFNVWLNVQVGRTLAMIGKIYEHPGPHSLENFVMQIGLWSLVVIGFLFSDPATQYQSRLFALDWRRAITTVFISLWGNVAGKTKLKGTSQRLQEEPYNFSKFFDSMGFQLLHAVLAAFGFGSEMWGIGPTMHVKWWFVDARPSILIIVAFGIFITGLLGAIFLGRKLPDMQSYNRDKEAECRTQFELVENGEIPYNKEALETCFQQACRSYEKMFRHIIPLEAWKSFYWNIIGLMPCLLGGLWMIDHVINYGGLMQLGFLFGQFMGAVSIFMNNWQQIVDFVATKKRLKQLRDAFEESR